MFVSPMGTSSDEENGQKGRWRVTPGREVQPNSHVTLDLLYSHTPTLIRVTKAFGSSVRPPDNFKTVSIIHSENSYRCQMSA